MNITEQWVRWEPIPGLADKYYIVHMIKNHMKFQMTLSNFYNHNNIISVTFSEPIAAYRSLDESYRLNTIYMLSEKYKSYILGWTFCKVKNSEYLHSFSKSSDMSDLSHLTHYAFVSVNSIVDVLASHDPTITVLDNDNNNNIDTDIDHAIKDFFAL